MPTNLKIRKYTQPPLKVRFGSAGNLKENIDGTIKAVVTPMKGANQKTIGRGFSGIKTLGADVKPNFAGRARRMSGVSDRMTGDMNMNKAASTMPCEYEASIGQEKTAASFVMPQGLANGFWTAAGTVAAGGMLAAAGAGLDALQNRMNKNKYEIALQQAIKLSPTLQMHGYNKLVGYLPMITKASPTVAEEPRLLANYLESMLDAEGHMNLATFGELTALEGNVLKNNDYRYNLRNELVGGVAKGMTEGTGKAFGTALANNLKGRYGA